MLTSTMPMCLFQLQSIQLLLLVANNIQLSYETMPLSLARKLSSVKSNEEFFQLAADGRMSAPVAAAVQLRSSPDDRLELAEFDGCRPRGTPVAIPTDPADPDVFYWPPCVNVSRCGGCCSHEALSCMPTVRSMIDVKVMMMRIGSGDNLQMSGEVTIQLESHSACDCECSVKPSDCDNRTQIYDAESCSCRCLNESSAAACRAPKYWDPHRCICICQNILNCLDDEYFNFGTCTCQKFPPNSIEAMPTTRPPSVTTNPCARYHCRPGLKPTEVSGQCMCLPAGR
jgi:hypothetical protein